MGGKNRNLEVESVSGALLVFVAGWILDDTPFSQIVNHRTE